MQPVPLATCMPRWRQALRKARTSPSVPRTTTSGTPAASRATNEPGSGSAAEGQNGVGVAAQHALLSLQPLGIAVILDRLAPDLLAEVCRPVRNMIQDPLRHDWSPGTADLSSIPAFMQCSIRPPSDRGTPVQGTCRTVAFAHHRPEIAFEVHDGRRLPPQLSQTVMVVWAS